MTIIETERLTRRFVRRPKGSRRSHSLLTAVDDVTVRIRRDRR